MQQTAIGWLVLRLTGSAAELGLVLAVGGVPSLLFGPWGGTVADRVNLRRLLIGTQTAYGVLAGVLWALAVAGKASVAAIVAISVADGVVQIVDSPARQAFVGFLVMPEDLSSAVSLNGVVMNSAPGDRPGPGGRTDRHDRHDTVFRGQRPVIPGRDRRAGDAALAAARRARAARDRRRPRGPAVRGPAASSCGCRWS